MKGFTELTSEQQKAGVEKVLNEVLKAVCEGIRFNDKLNKDDLQARIDKAVEEMEQMHTPWFLGERLMEDDYIKEVLTSMAQAQAEDAMWLETGEVTYHIA